MTRVLRDLKCVILNGDFIGTHRVLKFFKTRSPFDENGRYGAEWNVKTTVFPQN